MDYLAYLPIAIMRIGFSFQGYTKTSEMLLGYICLIVRTEDVRSRCSVLSDNDEFIYCLICNTL